MTDTPTATITALEVLKQTRDLFAKTHWTTGVLYTKTEDGKKQFCMIGGLCHIFTTSEAPDWVDKYDGRDAVFYPGAAAVDTKAGFDGWPNVDYGPILEAEYQLAKTIDPGITADASPTHVDDLIVGWNDGPAQREYKSRGDASYVIEVMDETIARVEAEQA
jgi:hypothetical protein